MSFVLQFSIFKYGILSAGAEEETLKYLLHTNALRAVVAASI